MLANLLVNLPFELAILSWLWYINNMDYAKEERIGNPALFTGRKEELAYFLKWINDIKENDVWIVDFCIDFCLTFVYQYIAFKTRKTRYLRLYEKGNIEKAMQVVESEGLDYLSVLLSGVKYAVTHGHVDILWETVREAPKTIAHSEAEFIVQMIDEFQFINALIYWDSYVGV